MFHVISTGVCSACSARACSARSSATTRPRTACSRPSACSTAASACSTSTTASGPPAACPCEVSRRRGERARCCWQTAAVRSRAEAMSRLLPPLVALARCDSKDHAVMSAAMSAAAASACAASRRLCGTSHVRSVPSACPDKGDQNAARRVARACQALLATLPLFWTAQRREAEGRRRFT